MNLTANMIGIIDQYEAERDPDLTISTEFKNGVRIKPTIKTFWSTTDFRKWLKKKMVEEEKHNHFGIEQSQLLKPYDNLIKLLSMPQDCTVENLERYNTEQWWSYAKEIGIELFRAEDIMCQKIVWKASLINEFTMCHGTFTGEANHPALAICKMAEKLGYDAYANVPLSRYISMFLQKGEQENGK